MENTASCTGGNTVVLGAGIIGLSTAYYLSLTGTTPPKSIYLVDSSPELFECASGRAAGFVAEDWFSPRDASLGALSFRLHKELAEEHEGRKKWGYCASSATYVAKSRRGERDTARDRTPRWLKRREGDKVDVMSDGGQNATTAQIQPLLLCRFLLNECVERGVTVLNPARPVVLSKDADGRLEGMQLELGDGETRLLPCSHVIFTCGAWTPHVFATLFPSSKLKLPVQPLAGYSVVVRSPSWTETDEEQGCHAVFSDDSTDLSPAIFSRLGEEIYVSGLNDEEDDALPRVATESQPKREFLDRLHEVAKRMLSDGEQLKTVKENMCYQPVTRKGVPIVGRVPDSKLGGDIVTESGRQGGVFVATGHGHWGISLSLGTGKVVSELAEGHTTSADITRLSP